jgi:hypothetical protein
LVPESARWLAVHGRVDAQKTWKRVLPCNQSDISNDTDSVKMITEELKCAGYGSGNSSENNITRNQQIVNNDVIQVEINGIPVDRALLEYANTEIQLPANKGKAYMGIMKQGVVEDKLKDCSGWCDVSSVGTEHIGIVPNHISSVENRSYSNLCKQDGVDSNKSQNSHYLKASDTSTIEGSCLWSCNIMNGCKKNIDKTHGVDKKKEKKLIDGEEMADVTLVHTNGQSSSSSTMKSGLDKEFKTEISCKESKGMLQGCSLDIINSDNMSVNTADCSYCFEIGKEIGYSQNSNEYNSLSFCRSMSRSESDGLNYIWTETAQDLKGDNETSIGVQGMPVITDKTITQYDDRDEGVCMGKTLAADDKKVGADPVRSTYRKIALGKEYGMVHENEIVKINNTVTEGNGTTSGAVYDRAVTVISSGKNVSHDDGVIWNNMAKKSEFTKHRTVTDTPKILDSATKRTGFFELFRSAVLRKYNLIMAFVW